MADRTLIGIAIFWAGAVILGVMNVSAAVHLSARGGPVVAVPAEPVSAALAAAVAPLSPYFPNPYHGYGFAYAPPHDGLALNIGSQ
ncbi:MAG TPA: hypothetical protein VH249_23275 [Xanthobacteraceae bacterium]|jgi:hypothetical protein|nr:hypothetical protein [Xanthobacteraceae bacterium]